MTYTDEPPLEDPLPKKGLYPGESSGPLARQSPPRLAAPRGALGAGWGHARRTLVGLGTGAAAWPFTIS